VYMIWNSSICSFLQPPPNSPLLSPNNLSTQILY
jgi:hypothetical protein